MSPKSLSASEHIHTFNRTSPTHCVYAYFGILFERKYILQIFVLRYELYAYEESRYEWLDLLQYVRTGDFNFLSFCTI